MHLLECRNNTNKFDGKKDIGEGNYQQNNNDYNSKTFLFITSNPILYKKNE